jgi:hypothetical protein
MRSWRGVCVKFCCKRRMAEISRFTAWFAWNKRLPPPEAVNVLLQLSSSCHLKRELNFA